MTAPSFSPSTAALLATVTPASLLSSALSFLLSHPEEDASICRCLDRADWSALTTNFASVTSRTEQKDLAVEIRKMARVAFSAYSEASTSLHGSCRTRKPLDRERMIVKAALSSLAAVAT